MAYGGALDIMVVCGGVWCYVEACGGMWRRVVACGGALGLVVALVPSIPWPDTQLLSARHTAASYPVAVDAAWPVRGSCVDGLTPGPPD